MLFEIFLVVGITLLPISLAVVLIGNIIWDEEKSLTTGGILFFIGIVSLILCFTLPPIPIIPQG